MNGRLPATRAGSVVMLTALASLSFVVLDDPVHAQRGRGRGGPPPAAKAAAPIDLTGYWVSVVTEDWRFRMLTPRKGDYESLPLTAEAKRVADAWDPAKDEAAGDQCKTYGPPGIMRAAGRLHITWETDDTLRIDADAGTQTRQFHFGGSPPAGGGAPTLEGQTSAQWEYSGGRQGPNPGGAAAVVSATAGQHGWLKAVTTRMRPGYLRKNGVPYSGNAVLTEYVDRLETGSQTWLIVTQMVEDPQYLTSTFVVSSNFKKEPDGSKWNPTPCSAR